MLSPLPFVLFLSLITLRQVPALDASFPVDKRCVNAPNMARVFALPSLRVLPFSCSRALASCTSFVFLLLPFIPCVAMLPCILFWLFLHSLFLAPFNLRAAHKTNQARLGAPGSLMRFGLCSSHLVPLRCLSTAFLFLLSCLAVLCALSFHPFRPLLERLPQP